MREPLIHSHITDVLPADHRYMQDGAEGVVFCCRCNAMLWHENECMQTWLETGIGDFCLKCFFLEQFKTKHYANFPGDALEEAWGLPDTDTPQSWCKRHEWTDYPTLGGSVCWICGKLEASRG